MKTHVGMIILTGALTISGCKRADSDTTSSSKDASQATPASESFVPGQIKTIEETTQDGRRVVMQVKIGEEGEEIRHGKFTAYHPNGNKWGESHFEDDFRQGKMTEWYSTGVKKKEGQFVDDKQDGVWTEWDRNGNQVNQFEFHMGISVTPQAPTIAPAPTTAPAAASKPTPTTQPASP